MTGGAPANWYSDPFGRHELRYWDGAQWTHDVASHGIQGTDAPVVAPSGPPATGAVATVPTEESSAGVAASGGPTGRVGGMGRRRVLLAVLAGALVVAGLVAVVIVVRQPDCPVSSSDVRGTLRLSDVAVSTSSTDEVRSCSFDPDLPEPVGGVAIGSVDISVGDFAFDESERIASGVCNPSSDRPGWLDCARSFPNLDGAGNGATGYSTKIGLDVGYGSSTSCYAAVYLYSQTDWDGVTEEDRSEVLRRFNELVDIALESDSWQC